MTVPLRVFVPRQGEDNPDDAGTLSQVFAYIQGLFEEQKK